jgi:hypothetical protein
MDHVPANGGRVQVDGAALDARGLALKRLGVPAAEDGATHVVVKRAGLDHVTFRDAAPGSETFTCTKS